MANLIVDRMMRFSHMIFYVSDVKETVLFYEKAFGFSVQFIHESEMYATLASGETLLAFASDELGESYLPLGYQSHSLKELPFFFNRSD